MNEFESSSLSQREINIQKAKLIALRAWGAIGVVLILAGIVFALGKVSQAVSILIVSIIFAFVIAPIANKLDDRGVPRIAATLISMLVVFAVFAVFMMIIVPLISNQLRSFVFELPNLLTGAEETINNLYYQYKDIFANTNIQDNFSNIADTLTSSLMSFINSSGQGIIRAGSSFVSMIATVFMSLVVAFWMVKDGPKIKTEAMRIAGPGAEQLEIMLAVFSRSLGGYLKGITIVSTFTGVLAGIGFAIIGVPYAAFLGLITGILNVIPIIGPWIGGGIAAIIGLFVSPLTAIGSIVVSVAAQQITDTFISPKVMYSAVSVHPMLVILGLAAGGALAGVAGMVLSVPLIAAFKGVFIYYFESKTGRQIVSENGALFTGTPHTDEYGNPEPAYDATGGPQYYSGQYKKKSSKGDTLMSLKRLTGSWIMPKSQSEDKEDNQSESNRFADEKEDSSNGPQDNDLPKI